MVATNKFIDAKYSESLKEWIKLTRVSRLFEEEKIEAVNQARKNERLQFAISLLKDGEDILKVMKHTGFARTEIEELQASVGV